MAYKKSFSLFLICLCLSVSLCLPLSSEERAGILTKVAEALLSKTAEIMRANTKDLKAAKANNIAPALLNRLKLTEVCVCFGLPFLHRLWLLLRLIPAFFRNAYMVALCFQVVCFLHTGCACLIMPCTPFIRAAEMVLVYFQVVCLLPGFGCLVLPHIISRLFSSCRSSEGIVEAPARLWCLTMPSYCTNGLAVNYFHTGWGRLIMPHSPSTRTATTVLYSRFEWFVFVASVVGTLRLVLFLLVLVLQKWSFLCFHVLCPLVMGASCLTTVHLILVLLRWPSSIFM